MKKKPSFNAKIEIPYQAPQGQVSNLEVRSLSLRCLVRKFLLAFFLLTSFPVLADSSMTVPDFSAHDIRGELRSPRQYAGKYLVIYFWATWCPACRADVQNMKAVHAAYAPKGVGFITVSLDQNLEQLEQFVENKGIRYPVLYDGRGWKNQIAQLYGINSTPTFVLVDPDQNAIAAGHSVSELPQHLKKIFS